MRGWKDDLRAFAAAFVRAFFGNGIDAVLREVPAAEADLRQRRAEYRRELATYSWGYGLALALTLFPFGLVYWKAMTTLALCLAIGACAIVQAAIHFRCFLHIDPPRQNTDDLQLILFSALLLFFMVAGTIWILANLATRMQ